MTAYKAMYWDVQKKAKQLKAITFLPKCSVRYLTMHCTLFDCRGYFQPGIPTFSNKLQHKCLCVINHCACHFFNELFVLITFFSYNVLT